MDEFSVAYLVLLGLLAAVELVAVLKKRRTVSDHVWAILRTHPLTYAIALGAAGWVLLHLFTFGWIDGVLR